MVITRVNGQLHDGRPRQAGTAAAGKPPVLSLLVELVRGLEKLGATADSAKDECESSQWNDDAFTYLEGDLPDDSSAEIDINIHDGRLYVRIAR